MSEVKTEPICAAGSSSVGSSTKYSYRFNKLEKTRPSLQKARCAYGLDHVCV